MTWDQELSTEKWVERPRMSAAVPESDAPVVRKGIIFQFIFEDDKFLDIPRAIIKLKIALISAIFGCNAMALDVVQYG